MSVILEQAGLSLPGVLETRKVRVPLPPDCNRYSQLLVFFHGGRRLWQAADLDEPDPVDSLSTRAVDQYLADLGVVDYLRLYPGNAEFSLDLRGLGRELGQHHDSMLGIGITPDFGTWFAYRVVVAADTGLAPTVPVRTESPCNTCSDKPCMSACPVGAAGPVFNLDACTAERLRPGSACADRCIARLACPVGQEHQYTEAQLTYHYTRSLAAIRHYQS